MTKKLYDSEVNSVQAMINQTNDLLVYRMQRIVEATYTIYLDNNLYHYLSSNDAESSQYDPYLIEEKLSTIVENGEALNASLFLVNEKKLPQPHFRSQSLTAGKEAVWYRELKNSGKKSLWQFTSAGGYYISSIYSKYDAEELVGYIVIMFSKELVMDILRNLRVTENSTACIMDMQDEILISTKEAIPGTWNAVLDSESFIKVKGRNSEKRFMINGDAANEKYYLAGRLIEEKQMPRIPKWKVLLLVPYEELVPFADHMLIVILLCAALCVLVLNFVASRIIGSITKRIDKLNLNMQRPQVGDFSCNDVPAGRDEISELRKNFNYMLSKTEQLLDEMVQANEREKDLELNMLQAQINPHFLYNTLDMINWAAISENPECIPEITRLLAKFYKLSLNNGARIVTLKEEIQHVMLYIGIQNKRFDSSLELQVQIPEMFQNCACIKIILQPIVENAVLHGIFEKDEPEGKIVLSAYKSGEDFYIEVADNGVGMSEVELQKLKMQIHIPGTGGYGLSNIEDRIRLCFGKGYGLFFSSKPGEYTKVLIKIRYREYDDSLKMCTKIR
ncbi:MAG: sensor histidine kinase [Eubacteriales bacterium]|nr:sensor histidine kinase [Eubacteriales bacterium]